MPLTNKVLGKGNCMIVSIILNVIFVILTVLCVVAIIQRKKQVKKAKAKKEKAKKAKLLEKLNYFIHQVELAKTLRDLYILHIKMWANGIRNENLGPDKYGMFRTDDILMMVPEEVYLGNIWGLWTKQLPYWESCSVNDQKLVIEQYKNVLLSNMKAIKRGITD